MIRVLSNYYAPPAMDLSNREVHVATLVKRSQIGCHNEQQPTAAVIRRAKWQYGLNKHRRSPRTTDTKRILTDLESDVINGLLTATEADRAYGKRVRGGGRRRRWPTFADWLRERIGELSPEALAALLDKTRVLQNDRTLAQAKRSAAVRALNAMLGKHDPAYIEKLRAALAEIELKHAHPIRRNTPPQP
jgi:hypothetical protein